MRNKDLLKFLKDMHPKMSMPTLSRHLKELVKKGILLRENGNSREVFYSLGFKKFEKTRKYLDMITNSYKIIDEEKKILFSMSVNNQCKELIRLSAIGALIKFKAKLSFRLKKDVESKLLLVLTNSPYFNRHELWIIEKCFDDENYRNDFIKTVNEIDTLIS